MSINEAFAEVILRSERATDRFERFCNAVVGKLEGDVEVFPTSASWDLGRDGRATTEKLFVCASLADDVDAKSERDAKRISENMRSPVRLYFCSSQPLSEKRCDEIASQLRALLPAGTDVQVLGSQQLAHAAEKHPDVFSAFYALEVNALNARLRDDAIAPNDDAALRLALIATTHETSDEVRTTLYRNAIRAVLRGKQLNLEESARDVTHIFRLAQGLPADSLRPHIDYLIEKGEVDRSGDRFALTARGEESLQIEQSQAQSELVAGRELIRARIEGGIGYRLADRQFDEIWRIIREKITAAFFERGQQLVAQVSALLNARTSEVQPDEPLFFLDDLASAVATTSSLPAQAEELRTAVKDMFEEPFGPAFEWLSKLCGAYVALCALGLEWHSGRALARVLSKMSLVLDTDIALSLLGEGEPNHAAVEGLVRRWTAIGGTVFVSKEVLHEVAHHAAIADYDFNQVRHWLPGRAEERLRLINNVLVRSFAHLLSEKRISPSQWQAYVNQFRRGGKEDPVKIAEIFAQEYSIRQLPPASNEELKTEEAAKAFLQARAAQGKEGAQAWIAHDKAGRDASLYAAIVRESRATRATDSERACVLVSSSRSLSAVEHHLTEVGEPQLVVSLGGAYFLLSLVPGVSLGIAAMQTLLFDLHARLTGELERVVVRIVHDSQDLSIPWAKRPALFREVRSRLYKEADKNHRIEVNTAEARAIEHDALDSSRLQRTAEVLRESLAAISADQRLEQENAELRAQVELLKRQLDEAKSKPSPRQRR